MMIDLGLILGGLLLLIAGAEALVRGASSIAMRAGVSTLVVGLTIVAFGTSSPELVFSVKAALAGQSDIALGNVIGSNICNVLLILGLTATIFPIKIHWQILRIDYPIMVTVLTLFSLILLVFGFISRTVGILFILLIVSYTVFTILYARKTNIKEVEADVPDRIQSIWLMLGFLVAGPILLSLGADLMLQGATSIARKLGVSEAVIGLTLVAFGGSLPELATALGAAFRKHSDMVIGNIIGSNIFNVLSIIGITATIKPMPMNGIQPIDVYVMLGSSLLLAPLMIGLILNRWKGLLMFITYLGFIAYLLKGP